MGCEFCASTKTKFEGILTTGEFVSQIQVLEKEENIRISNVVFMGIGEPLDNFENVVNALMIMNDPFRIKYWSKTY